MLKKRKQKRSMKKKKKKVEARECLCLIKKPIFVLLFLLLGHLAQ